MTNDAVISSSFLSSPALVVSFLLSSFHVLLGFE